MKSTNNFDQELEEEIKSIQSKLKSENLINLTNIFF